MSCTNQHNRDSSGLEDIRLYEASFFFLSLSVLGTEKCSVTQSAFSHLFVLKRDSGLLTLRKRPFGSLQVLQRHLVSRNRAGWRNRSRAETP